MSQRLLGEVLEPFWVPGRCLTGKTRFVDHPLPLPRVAQRVQNRPKTIKKSNEKSRKFLLRFRNDFKPISLRFCPKGDVIGSFFRPRREHAKSVISNNTPSFLLYFSYSKATIFDTKWYIFLLFFRRCL